MAHSIKARYLATNETEQESMKMLVEISILGNGKTISLLDRESKFLQLNRDMRDKSKTGKNKEKGHSILRMEISTKEPGYQI